MKVENLPNWLGSFGREECKSTVTTSNTSSEWRLLAKYLAVKFLSPVGWRATYHKRQDQDNANSRCLRVVGCHNSSTLGQRTNTWCYINDKALQNTILTNIYNFANDLWTWLQQDLAPIGSSTMTSFTRNFSVIIGTLITYHFPQSQSPIVVEIIFESQNVWEKKTR